MNILRSNDVKRINKAIIRKALLALRNATRKELMEKTGISSSSIGSLIMEMVHDLDILEESIDISTGGRCPIRYVLNHAKYRVLCIQMDREQACIRLMDSLYQQIYFDVIRIVNKDEFIAQVQAICESQQVLNIQFSAPGIIKEDLIITDNEFGLYENDIILKMKEAINIPIEIDNDVNCMVQGYCFDHEDDISNISYLYLSDEGGFGCSSIANGDIVRGNDHLAGEIGLLEFNGISANNIFREHPSDTLMSELLAELLSILVVCINPSRIILAGTRLKEAYVEDIKRHVQKVLTNRFSLQIAFDDICMEHINLCLWHKGMELLLKEQEEPSFTINGN